ncbi:MAG: hypothetical protein Kow0092_30450 [Deferrisomatales bacterium]
MPRGAAYGWVHAAMGLMALPASVLFGSLWAAWGAPVAFGVGAALAVGASALLAAVPGSAGAGECERAGA